MKKKILTLTLGLSLLLLGSCNGANDSFLCMQSVENKYPDAISVESLTGEKYRFLVMDNDSSVYYVRTLNANNPKVSSSELVFKHN